MLQTFSAAFVFLISLLTLISQFYITIGNSIAKGAGWLAGIGDLSGYFTIWANVLVGVALFSILFLSKNKLGRFFNSSAVQTALAVYILIVFIIYNLFLRRYGRIEGLRLIVDIFLHIVIPFSYILYWFFHTPKGSFAKRQSVIWLCYPVFYLIYILIRSVFTHKYPYFFLDPNTSGVLGMALNIFGLMILISVMGLGFILLDRTKKHPTKFDSL